MTKTLTSFGGIAAAIVLAAAILWLGTGIANASSTLFGDATMLNAGGNPGGVLQIRSDAMVAPNYGGISFDDLNGSAFSSLTTIGTDFNVTDDNCGAGAPRIDVAVTNGVDSGNISLYLGPAPSFNSCTPNTWTSSGNLVDGSHTLDTSQLTGGTFYDTYAHALSAYGSYTITGIQVVTDGSWNSTATGGDGEQTILIDNTVINSATYAYTPQPQDVHVDIIKYVDGQHATVGNANGATFPFTATYNASNIGAGSDPFTIGPVGNGTPNSYEARTIALAQGADYSASENTTGNNTVGATCADGKPFALNGYSSGDTLLQAQNAATTTAAPAFTGLTSDKFVIVWNKTCPAQDVTVTIIKYIGGTHATSGSASGASFPMASSWNAMNLGGPGSGTYALSPSGFNSPNPYEAVTSNMTNGSSYATNENLGTPVVGTNCANGQQFRHAGYTTGDSLMQAQGGTLSSTSPALTNITTDKWVIVWNEPCPTGPTPPVANACSLQSAPAGYTLQNGTAGSDTVTLAPNTMFKGKGGNDKVTAPDGNYIICTTGGNDTISIGNGDYTIDAGAGNNTITTGNGSGYITSGGGNDTITTGNGAHTITAGAGNNTITTGNGVQNVTVGGGNDKITTGSGNDSIAAGGGNNTVKSNGGDDTITAGGGNDIIDGGTGTDTCSAGGGMNTVTNCP